MTHPHRPPKKSCGTPAASRSATLPAEPPTGLYRDSIPTAPPSPVEGFTPQEPATDPSKKFASNFRPRPRGPIGLASLWTHSLLGATRQMFYRNHMVKPLNASGEGATTARQREWLVRAAMQQDFDHDTFGRKVARPEELGVNEQADVLFASSSDPHLPSEVFDRLRWGGLFVYVGAHEGKVRRLAEQFNDERGYLLEREPTSVWGSPLGMRFPGMRFPGVRFPGVRFPGMRFPGVSKRGFTFAARKTHLIHPGEFTERFTYDVQLVPESNTTHGYVVRKSVPTEEDIFGRLRKKFPDAEEEDLKQRAHKLVAHIFPTFLTREAAMLKILQRDLPPGYRDRVPHLLHAEHDEQGFVQSLSMNWMRVGGPVLSQMQFARQAAELLTVLHEHARVIHLDLRLDNLVITERGVGFVDFGSSVRVGEKFEQSPMLTTLFSEMMRTSQIQRMLGRMVEDGRVTNQAMTQVHQKVDKTLDTFYLAVLITKPHGNPHLNHLIARDPKSPRAVALAALTAAVLRPKNPKMASFKSAADILRGIRRIEAKYAAFAAA